MSVIFKLGMFLIDFSIFSLEDLSKIINEFEISNLLSIVFISFVFLISELKSLKTIKFLFLIFSLINYARFVNVNPEDALEKTNKKFIQRFQYMEKQIKAKGQELSDLTLKEMDVYWNEAKTI